MAEFQVTPVTAIRLADTAIYRLTGMCATAALPILIGTVGEPPSTRFLVLNVREVPFMTGAAVEYLVRVSDALMGRGGAVIFLNLHPKVKVVMDALGVVSKFRLESDLGSAATYINQRAGR